MITHFLGRDEVAGFALDLAQRLSKLAEAYPTAWFVLGKSGQNFAELLVPHVPQERVNAISVVRVYANRDTGEVKFLDDPSGMTGTAILIDSAVHSGKSMLAAAKAVAALGFHDVISYSLVVKRNSAFVPNYFGILVDETDRCLFQLDAIPNNRLCERPPFGLLRAIAEADSKLPFFDTGEKSVQETDFSSLVYENAKGSHVYIYEHSGQPIGVLSFTESRGSIFIDLIANSVDYRGKGIGAALMRWAETWARSTKRDFVELWAIKKRIDFYRARDFEEAGRELKLGDTPYCLMRRKLLYNMSFVDQIATA